jgi:hypothetical protein
MAVGFRSKLAHWFGGAGVAVAIVASGGVSFGFSATSHGTEKFKGSGGPTYQLSISATGGSQARSGFRLPFPSARGLAGRESISNQGDLTFQSSMQGSGTPRYNASGGPTYLFSVAGYGSGQFEATGNLAFSVSVSSAGVEKFTGQSNGRRLTWDANTEPDLSGYRIYFGTSSGEYGTEPIDVGNVTTYQVKGLNPAFYYFTTRAYNTAGQESADSNEVSGEISGLYFTFAIAGLSQPANI